VFNLWENIWKSVKALAKALHNTQISLGAGNLFKCLTTKGNKTGCGQQQQE